MARSLCAMPNRICTGARIRRPVQAAVYAGVQTITMAARTVPARSLSSPGAPDHVQRYSFARFASQDECLLASSQLSVGRPDLSLRQPVAQGAACALACEAAGGGALGDDAWAEFHLRAFE